ncbi:LytTR family DNA-binding domain-containing protein [Erythrobacter rubeus]|uniref:LytTR family transcriptional regulator DNA-binding domain-containing protein n=1 Tax=Erythrobacter rubeus TaxID=2760803 RepID=A0ABR8KPM7_9SPHN|nr:LytTR family DNA-binding domain-containing protein [Erythrobacter rubeus]MBD2842605.1 LytTR family transcriptional regulator DNA-binding domain-containing protein [Erythrobacter rubeus]
MIVGGLFMGWTGALGSYQYPIGMRLSIWLGLCTAAGFLALSIESLIVKGGVDRRGIVATGIGLTIGLALAMTPIVYMLNSLGTLQPASQIVRYFGNSLVISSVLVGGRMLVGLSIAGQSAPSQAGEEIAQAPFLKRLKPSMRESEIWSLRSEGHYVRVYTSVGEDLILIRLKDAIEEMGSVDGRQVHRSWWVARAAIEEAVQEKGKTLLKVRPGLTVPVSRKVKPELSASGWI